MNEANRLTFGVLGIVVGFALIAFAGLLLSSALNQQYPGVGYATLEMGIAGVVLVATGYSAISRPTAALARLSVQLSGGILGAALFGVGIGLQATAGSYSPGGLLVELTATLAGLAVASLALSAALGPTPTSVSGTQSGSDPVPSGSGFCPYCGEPTQQTHLFCRKCGRPMAK